MSDLPLARPIVAAVIQTVGWTTVTVTDVEVGPSVPVMPVTVDGEIPDAPPQGFVVPFPKDRPEPYKVDYENDDWYADIYRFCTRQEKSKNLNRQEMSAFEKKDFQFMFNSRTNRLVHNF